MTFTYQPENSLPQNLPLARVRLLISDVDEAHHIFEDEELTGFLDLSGDEPLLAAALALDTIAADEALTSKAIRTQDLQTNGPAVAKSLMERADRLRAQHSAAVEAADDGWFEVVDMAPGCTPELAPGWL